MTPVGGFSTLINVALVLVSRIFPRHAMARGTLPAHHAVRAIVSLVVIGGVAVYTVTASVLFVGTTLTPEHQRGSVVMLVRTYAPRIRVASEMLFTRTATRSDIDETQTHLLPQKGPNRKDY